MRNRDKVSAFPSTLAPQGAKREQVPGPNKGGICKGSLPVAVALREGPASSRGLYREEAWR